MKKYTLLILLVCLFFPGMSQPHPGDVFREYIWTTPEYGNSEKFLRVGGRFDYRAQPEKYPPEYIKEGYVTFPGNIDPDKMIRAEIQVEKDQCHEGTTGLAIQLNGSTWFKFPDADSIPHPVKNYLHHTYPAVQIPVGLLEKSGNKFKLKVDSIQEWNWPQNLIYAVILRIYYERDKLPFQPEVVFPDGMIPVNTGLPLKLNAQNPEKIRDVIYLGNYMDVNYEGDGKYKQWHYSWYRGKRTNHIGEVKSPPFEIQWDTRWVPDQDGPVRLGALVRFQDDLIYFTEPVELPELTHKSERVVLCKPYGQPEKWTTRAGEFAERFRLDANPEEIIEYQLVWASWSPCYANGIYINDMLLYLREDPCYDFKFHRVILKDKRSIKEGINLIRTGQTPLDRDGNMVHGMDVQWPGIMVLVKLKN